MAALKILGYLGLIMLFVLEMFVCGDQLLRGAALNAVLVAESRLGCGPPVPMSNAEWRAEG